MINVNSLVIYKSFFGKIQKIENSKFFVEYGIPNENKSKPINFCVQSVREKDIILLNNSNVTSLENIIKIVEEKSLKIEDYYNINQTSELFNSIKDAWELLSSEEKKDFTFEEIFSVVFNESSIENSAILYNSLINSIYFLLNQKEFSNGNLIFTLRSSDEIDSLIKKNFEKSQEEEIRKAFLSRLKSKELLPDDSKFMVDVEALALGKSAKSKTLNDAHMKETPENAHKILLETKIWDITRNPYPFRWGLSVQSLSEAEVEIPSEERFELPVLAYAIDNDFLSIPDDAVCFDGKYLWIHIADPASAIQPESEYDILAKKRGATLYLPEGAVKMLSSSFADSFALENDKKNYALSFKLLLDEDANILDCDVVKTFIKVKRLTYAEADTLMESPELKPLFEIAQKNFEKRSKSGAIQINMPEVDIFVDEEKKVHIDCHSRPKSTEVIREMMLLAGEAAAKFAFKNNIPFPYISQDKPDIPSSIPDGLAGQYRLRKCMKRRNVGVSPAMHCSLGLNMYSQVTSPLRRYGDLVAHMQLRAFLDGRKPIDKDALLIKISEGEATAVAAKMTERKSVNHWTLVYLLQNPEWIGEAVCLDNTQKLPYFSIPSLGMESYINPSREVSLNEIIKVKASNINIPELSVDFIAL